MTEREVLSGDVDESLGLVGGDGIVDQAVHRAEGIDRRRDNPLGGLRIAQIGDDLFDAAGRPELVGGRGKFLVLDVGQQDRRPAFEQRGGDAFTDALGGASDDRDVAAHRVRVGVAHSTGPIRSGTPRCIS